MQHAFGESSKNIIALLFFDRVGEKYKLEEIENIDVRETVRGVLSDRVKSSSNE